MITNKGTKTCYWKDTGVNVGMILLAQPAGRTRVHRRYINPDIRQLKLRTNVGLYRGFIWCFIIADDSRAIISVDFLARYNLLVDMPSGRFIDSEMSLPAVWFKRRTICDKNCFRKRVLREYWKLFRKIPDQSGSSRHSTRCYWRITLSSPAGRSTRIWHDGHTRHQNVRLRVLFSLELVPKKDHNR